MAISYDIAERHDAKINVKTSTSGTTFIVRFKKS
jgi:signal transduction histidine kinase